MKPLDPRLLRHATQARPALAAVVALGTAQAALIIAQALVLADLVVRAVSGEDSARDLAAPLAVLVILGAARGAATWLTEVAGAHAALRVTTQLRAAALAHSLELGPAWLSLERRGALTALLTRGITALEPYVGRYLPALALAAIVPPIAIGAIAVHDPWSALIIVATLPLVPIFGALVGWATERRAGEQWRTMAALAGHFADVTGGLPTLVAHRRATAQSPRIAQLTREHARASMSTLRLAFASAAVLELVATISVALVAVSVGLRLLESAMDFRTALVVLLLAPEAYWPLRRVGAQFHAATEGIAAFEEVARVLETPLPRRGKRTDVPDLRTSVIALRGVVVRYPDRGLAALGPLSADLRPGRLHVVTGPSGSGKSTILHALLGFAPIASGTVTLDGAPLEAFDPDAVRAQIAWLPQQPALPTTCIGDYVKGLRPEATDADVWSALREVELTDVVGRLPGCLAASLDSLADVDPEVVRAAGLSAGERARLALARVIVAQRPVALLDEPSARLDADTERVVGEAVKRLAAISTVVLVTHRESIARLADTRIVLVPQADDPRPLTTAPLAGAWQLATA